MPATRANPARGLRPLALVLAAAVTATACGRSQEQDRTANLAASEAVSFSSADGVKLDGRLFGDGPVGVVLSHMLPADQTSWWDFARKLSEGGYMALAFDFRGFCPGGDAGCSEGDKDIGAMWQDVVGAIGLLRSEGATQVMLVGASMGGTASLVAAAQDGVEVSVVVTLSAPVGIDGLAADANLLTRITAAKLFIAGTGDRFGAAEAAQRLYAQSPLPKRVVIVTSNDHGTDLLTGNQSGRVQTLILGYLDERSGP